MEPVQDRVHLLVLILLEWNIWVRPANNTNDVCFRYLGPCVKHKRKEMDVHYVPKTLSVIT